MLMLIHDKKSTWQVIFQSDGKVYCKTRTTCVRKGCSTQHHARRPASADPPVGLGKANPQTSHSACSPSRPFVSQANAATFFFSLVED